MFYKKSRAKVGKKYKWFPRAVTLGNPVDTNELAKYIQEMSTASPGDVHLVLRTLPTALAFFMNSGKSVHIDGLGSFHYKLSCAGQGVDTPEEVSTKQIKSIRVQFLPEREGSGKRKSRPLVQQVSLTELAADPIK